MNTNELTLSALIDADLWHRVLKAASLFASLDDSRPALRGVLVDVKEADEVILASSDAYRLGKFTIKADLSTPVMLAPCLLDPLAVQLMLSALDAYLNQTGGIPSTNVIHLQFDTQLGADGAGVCQAGRYSMRLPSGEEVSGDVMAAQFPPYQNLIDEPSSDDGEPTFINPKLLTSIAEAFIIASGDENRDPVSVETNGLKALKFECLFGDGRGEVRLMPMRTAANHA
jgi:hypothetical protein